MEDGIHELDVIHWLVNAQPKLIQAQGGNNVYRDRETIDNAGLLIEFSNHVRCNFGFSLFTPGAKDGRVMRFYGTKGEMTYRRESDGQYVVVTPYHGDASASKCPTTKPMKSMSGMIFENAATPRPRPHNAISTYRLHRDFLKSMESALRRSAMARGPRRDSHCAGGGALSADRQIVPWDSDDITL